MTLQTKIMLGIFLFIILFRKVLEIVMLWKKHIKLMILSLKYQATPFPTIETIIWLTDNCNEMYPICCWYNNEKNTFGASLSATAVVVNRTFRKIKALKRDGEKKIKKHEETIKKIKQYIWKGLAIFPPNKSLPNSSFM